VREEIATDTLHEAIEITAGLMFELCSPFDNYSDIEASNYLKIYNKVADQVGGFVGVNDTIVAAAGLQLAQALEPIDQENPEERPYEWIDVIEDFACAITETVLALENPDDIRQVSWADVAREVLLRHL